jgi:hypothetical protein
MQRKIIRKCFEQILSFLNLDWTENCYLNNQIWLNENLDILKKVIVAQGVGPYLYKILMINDSICSSQAELFSWLKRLYEMNAIRIQTLHAELESILIQANRIGIPVMPMKGSLLTSLFYTPPAIRPMADIDLLIKPDDFPGIKSILEEAGYELIKSETSYANHHKFLKPNNEKVVARDLEHPDNPRPVEIHTELRRPFFGNSGEVDLTALIWKDSNEIRLFNHIAISPTRESLFTYLAAHASGHFFIQSGRILHWLDLAFIFNEIDHITPTHIPERIYFPLKLASRAFPYKFANTDFSQLEDKIDQRFKKWTTQIPLDDRCGLSINIHGPQKNKLHQRFIRWKPLPWRLLLTYGSIPLISAYFQYLNSFLGRTNRLFK